MVDTLARPTLGKQRSPIAVVLLSLVTLGIYWLVYVFKTSKEIKAASGIGIGAGLMLLITLVFGIVTPFLLASNVASLRERVGQPAKVSAATALWLLLPILGIFVYVGKVQGALNEHWASMRG